MELDVSISRDLTLLQKEAQKVRRELRSMPRGILMIQMKKGQPEYLRVTRDRDGRRKRALINRNTVLVYKLAHKAYLQEKLARLENDIAVCGNAAKHWSPFDEISIMTAMPKHFELLKRDAVAGAHRMDEFGFKPCPCCDGSVSPVIARLDTGGMDIDEWASMPYCENTKFQESKIHRTSNGLMCRTKGEAALIELCNALGYRYHYDEAILVCGKLRSPDLIIARRDGSLVYVEHRGWKGDAYEWSNLEKDRLYFHAGIRQGRNYLITFESDDGGIDIALVEMQLRKIVEG